MDFGAARENMIDCQLRTNKVTDERILKAMASLPRERFVPREREDMAYVDVDIPCGEGRCLMSAMVSARLIQEARLQRADEVHPFPCLHHLTRERSLRHHRQC